MSNPIADKNLYLSMLAMDSYIRGYDQGLLFDICAGMKFLQAPRQLVEWA